MEPWPRIYKLEELEALPVEYAVYPLNSPSIRLRRWLSKQVEDGELPDAIELIQMAGVVLAMAGVFGCLGAFILLMWWVAQSYTP
jgi:hypothetical protein